MSCTLKWLLDLHVRAFYTSVFIVSISSSADVNKLSFFWNFFTVHTLLLSERSVGFFFLREISTCKKYCLDYAALNVEIIVIHTTLFCAFICIIAYGLKRSFRKYFTHTFVGFLYKTLLFECFRKASAIWNRGKPSKCWFSSLILSKCLMKHT